MEWSHLCLLIIVGLAVAKDFTEQEIQVLTKTPEELWEIYKVSFLYKKVAVLPAMSEVRVNVVICIRKNSLNSLELSSFKVTTTSFRNNTTNNTNQKRRNPTEKELYSKNTAN